MKLTVIEYKIIEALADGFGEFIKDVLAAPDEVYTFCTKWQLTADNHEGIQAARKLLSEAEVTKE